MGHLSAIYRTACHSYAFNHTRHTSQAPQRPSLSSYFLLLPLETSMSLSAFRLQCKRIFRWGAWEKLMLDRQVESSPSWLQCLFLRLSREENILNNLAFRIIQFLDMTTFWKGISGSVAGGQCSAVSGRWWINSNASSECDARLWGPVCDLDDFDNFAVPYVSREGLDACVKRRWKNLGNIFDASGRIADIHEQTIAVPTSAVDQLRAPTV
jgi:hypothetical protein